MQRAYYNLCKYDCESKNDQHLDKNRSDCIRNCCERKKLSCGFENEKPTDFRSGGRASSSMALTGANGSTNPRPKSSSFFEKHLICKKICKINGTDKVNVFCLYKCFDKETPIESKEVNVLNNYMII